MAYQPCPDLIYIPEPPAETPDMVEDAAAVARAERQGRMLARLAELGMELAEAVVAQGVKEGAAEAAGAFAKLAQAVRRTIALEAHVAEELGRRRGSLGEKRAARREKARADHEEAKTEAIEMCISDAVDSRLDEVGETDEPNENGDIGEALRAAADEWLTCSGEFDGYLQRPVGETVARLCEALGLDPDWSVETEAGWRVKILPFSLPPSSRVPPPPKGAGRAAGLAGANGATGPPGSSP